MQILKRLPPKAARRTGIVLFVIGCVAPLLAITLPFVSLPISGPMKAGLITVLAVSGEVAFAASLGLLGSEFMAKIKSFVSLPTAPFAGFFAIMGLVVWLIATLLIRLAGQYLFVPNSPYLTIGAFVGVAVLMAGLMTVLYRIKGVWGSQRLEAAVLFAVPGMLLDAGTVFFFTNVFPNMPAQASSLFAAWLFWGYSIVLLTGVITPKGPNEPNQRHNVLQ
ncbi:DUF5367 family protein [Spirosoma soli]|uniref:DUF5367 family protein n=1 Tax=Spirosoma soli TaxID=1770529 RepID=A0ABW5M9G2_9BACT